MTKIKIKSVDEQKKLGGVQFVPGKEIDVHDGDDPDIGFSGYWIAPPGIMILKSFAEVLNTDDAEP